MSQPSESRPSSPERANADVFKLDDPGIRAGRDYRYDDRGGSAFVPIVVTISIICAVAAGAYFYLVSNSVPDVLAPLKAAVTPAPPPSPYKKVYEQFGIEMPPDFERRNPKIVRYLDQFRREPCDSGAIMPFIEALADAGYPREAGVSGRAYLNGCKLYDDLVESTYAYFQRVNDYTSALAIAEIAVKADQASGRYRFYRGTAHEALKNYPAALADYTSTLQLFTDLSNVAVSEFYRVSRMHAAIGKPCDAITPLETYISFDVKKRQTTQLTRMITDYANAGNCRASYANGGDRIIIGERNLVDVLINCARGRMIVDTGASTIAITPAFAARAQVTTDDENMITAQAVGSKIQMAPGYAQLVQFGNTKASNVPLAVSTGNSAAFGQQIDGLLGMTYLPRFNMSLSRGVLELKPRPLD